MTDMKQFQNPVLLLAWGIFGSASLWIIWAFVSTLMSIHAARKWVRDYTEGQDLAKLKADFEGSTDKGMRQSWRHFSQGLIDRDGGWKRTHEPLEAFHAGDLLDTAFKVEFMRHVPGILTGIGILCTFTGMHAGLNQAENSLSPAASNTPGVNTTANGTSPQLEAGQAATKKLQDVAANLLGSVGPAVGESLIAVTLAIIFLGVERALYTISLTQLEGLHRDLHAAFPRLTDSDLLHSLEKLSLEIRQQTNQSAQALQALDATSRTLQSTAEVSAEVLLAFRDYTRQTLDPGLVAVQNLDKNGLEARDSLQALAKTVEPTLSHVSAAREHLKSVELSSKNHSEHLEDLVSISRELREHSEESMNVLKGNNTDFTVMLQTAIEKGMNSALEPQIARQSLQFAQSHEALNQSVSQMGVQLESALNRIQHNAADASGAQMEVLASKFQDMFMTTGQNQITQMFKSVEGLSEVLAAQRLSQESFNESLQSHHASSQSHLQHLTQEMANQLGRHQETLSTSSNQLLSQVGQDVSAHLVRAQTHQTEVLLQFRSHVDESLRSLSQQVTGASDGTIASFKELLEVVQNMSVTTTSSSKEMLENGNRSMLDSVTRLTEDLLATSRTHNQELQETLQQFRLSFQSGLQQLTEQVDRTGQTSTEAAKSLLAVASGLTQQVETSTRTLQTQLQSGSQDAIQQFSRNLTSQAENQIGQMQSSFHELLEDLTNSMQESLRESRQTQTTVNQQVQSLLTKMESFGLSTSDSTEKFAGSVRSATGEIERLLTGLQSPLQRLTTLSQNFGQQSEQLQKLTAHFETASESLAEGSQVVQKSLRDQEAQRLQTERSLSLAIKQGEALEEYRIDLAQSLEIIRKQMLQLQTLAGDVSSHSQVEFSKMREEAGRYNTLLTGAVANFLGSVQTHLATGIDRLGGAIEELGDKVETLSDILPTGSSGPR